MTSSYCPRKETEVSKVVGTPTLVITWPRAGESRSSRDFTNKLVTLGSLSPLIFLALLAISGIDFPWPLHLADFQKSSEKGFGPIFQLLNEAIILARSGERSFHAEFLPLSIKSAC